MPKITTLIECSAELNPQETKLVSEFQDLHNSLTDETYQDTEDEVNERIVEIEIELAQSLFYKLLM